MSSRNRMTLLTLALGSLVALGACSKKEGGGNPYLAKAVKAHSGTMKGQAFTVQIPDGLKLVEERGNYYFRSGDQFDYPQVEVSDAYDPPKTPEEAKKKLTEYDKDNLIQKAANVGGGIVVLIKAKATSSLTALYYLPAGEVTLECKASWLRNYDDPDIPEPAKTLPWLEQICLTLKTK